MSFGVVMRFVRACQAAALFLGLAACAPTVSPRPQLLVVVDSDAHVVGELASRPEVSDDAAVDTLRVDLVNANGEAQTSQLFLVPSPAGWPVSFGIEPPPGGGSVLVRLRAFRSSFAIPGTLNGAATLDPPKEVTIDRLVALSFPSSGVTVAAVLLAEDCMGAAPDFQAPATTCIDAADPAADPHEQVGSAAPALSKIGSWAPGVETPCAADAGADRACIPGGFAILGDLGEIGGAELTLSSYPPAPLRPVHVAPFLLDRHEFTVGRFRPFVLAKKLTAPKADVEDADACSWVDENDPSHDDLPINCVEQATAALACQLAGGRLPTEPEWEFEARGRGARRTYPWGNAPPGCCTANLLCPNAGGSLESVGSHPKRAACAGDGGVLGAGDVSRDGIFDMGGSLTETLSTVLAPYAAPCWADPSIVLAPPRCEDAGTINAARGSNWTEPLATAYGAQRNSYTRDATVGFRCAWSVGGS